MLLSDVDEDEDEVELLELVDEVVAVLVVVGMLEVATDKVVPMVLIL